jgi:ABC-type uncharacterized transport system YnjBCD permease subunit
MTLEVSLALRNQMTAIILAVLVCSMNGFVSRKTTVLLMWLYPILDLLMETLMIGMTSAMIRAREPHTLTGRGTLRLS